MPNLPLAFAELLGGGVLLTAGLTGHSIPDVFAGEISLQPFDAGGTGASSSQVGGGVDPFGQATGVKLGRVDQGVDATMTPGSAIVAPFPSRVVRVDPSWYAGQPAVFFQVTDGPHKGKFWYLGEQITPHVKVGDTVAAGDQVASYAPHGTGIEIGWAKDATTTLARATTGYVEGHATPAGQDFLAFLHGVAQ